jgi:hypothetical protein
MGFSIAIQRVFVLSLRLLTLEGKFRLFIYNFFHNFAMTTADLSKAAAI